MKKTLKKNALKTKSAKTECVIYFADVDMLEIIPVSEPVIASPGDLIEVKIWAPNGEPITALQLGCIYYIGEL